MRCARPGSIPVAGRGIYQALAASLLREPRVMPAMLADLFSRPEGPTGRVFLRYFPRALDSVGGWLAAEVRTGRIRALPVPLLIQQLIGPLGVHLLFRPAMARRDRKSTRLNSSHVRISYAVFCL